MPVSDPGNLTTIARTICHSRPTSLLDLGCGFGKYGVIAREYLDIEPGRIRKEDWRTRIVGVEGFEGYRNPLWDVYTTVHIENFTEMQYSGFDLVLLVDSLEHVEKSVGYDLLRNLLEHNKQVLVSCPFGRNYCEQGAVNGNELERHKAHWTPQDFEFMGGKILHESVCVVALLKGL
jgi:2-polyprenyl-3-methyl-5-hydroxy-6-metoxy-1,4-benzoquinol methylase